MVSLKNFLRHSIGSTASAISAPIALPVKSNPVIHASRSSADADSPVSIHTPFFKQLILRKSTRSTASTDESPISSPVVVNQTSGTSRAVTSAGSLDLVQSHLFLQPDRFRISLGCSTDHSTAALMVIAQKFGCYTGKASLYAWNSFTPEDFSLVLVELMTDLVMNSYSPCSGLIELIVPPEVILLYGSLPRPPESCFISCSLHRFPVLVCDWFIPSISLTLDYGTLRCEMDSEASYRHQHHCRQGEQLKFAVDPCCLDLCDCQAECHNILLLKSLACEVYVLMSMNFRGLQMLAPLVHGSFINLSTANAALVQHLRCWFHLFSLDKQQADATINFWLQYCKTFTGFKDSTSCLGMLFAVAESFFWFSDSHIWSDMVYDELVYFLGTRHGRRELDRLLQEMEIMSETSYFFLRIMQVSIQTDRSEISGLELLLKQSLPQAFLHLFNEDYGFLRCIYVTISAGFGFLTEIPYGSLPRPPDELLVISFSLLYFTLCSSCPRCNGLHLEGEY